MKCRTAALDVGVGQPVAQNDLDSRKISIMVFLKNTDDSVRRQGREQGRGGGFMPSESLSLRLFAKIVGKGTYNPVQSDINN